MKTHLEEYESDFFDQTLSQFYAKIQKENGDVNEPDFLKVKQASLGDT